MSKYFQIYSMQKYDKNKMFIGFFSILIIFQGENNKIITHLLFFTIKC